MPKRGIPLNCFKIMSAKVIFNSLVSRMCTCELIILYIRSIMQLFYSTNIVQDLLFLEEDEHIHLSKTLRKRVGDIIQVMDGMGGLYECELTDIKKKESELKIISKSVQAPLLYKNHIALGPTKNISRFEWFLEKCTELGVTHITPIESRYSERSNIRVDRCMKIIVAAAKQSKNLILPVLEPMIDFKSFVSKVELSQKYIAYVPEDQKYLHQSIIKGSDCLVCVGPEGGFDPKEIEFSKQHNFVPVSLGNSRLRTETAGVAACHTIVLNNL